MLHPDSWVPLGVIGRPRGLRGDVWFRAYNEATEALAPGVRVRLTPKEAKARAAVIEWLVDESQGLLAHFEGVNDREAAEALTGARVELQRKDFPPLGEGEYYHCDLPGMTVFDRKGERVGEVVRVEAYPTIDALVVKTADGEIEVPVSDAFVDELDVAGGRVVIDADAVREG